MTGHYGGTVIATRAVGSQLYDSENIEYTLGPHGPLIDGSTGVTLHLKESPGTGNLVNVPIGRYTIGARYKGNYLLLRDRYKNG